MKNNKIYISYEKMFLVGGIALFVGYLTYIAAVVQVNFFDTFSLYRNAKEIASGSLYTYTFWRSSLMSVVFSPLFMLENMIGLNGFALTVGRLLGVGFFVLLMKVAYTAFAEHGSCRAAIWGIALFGLNPIVLHQIPFGKSDIPGTLFTILTFFYYARCRVSAGYKTHWFTALSIAAAVSLRYSLLPLIFLVIAVNEIIDIFLQIKSPASGSVAQYINRIVKSVAFFCVIPITIFILIPAVIYVIFEKITIMQAISKYIGTLTVLRNLAADPEPPIQNLLFLIKSMSAPVFVLGGIGVWRYSRTRTYGGRVFVLWLAVFFIGNTFLYSNEARYLMQLFPAVYFFAGAGFVSVTGYLSSLLKPRSINPGKKKIILFGACGLLLVLPILGAVRGCVRFLDPVYHVPFEATVSTYAQTVAEEKNIYWINRPYPLHPRDYLFDENDEFTYIYHFSGHVVYFYTGKPVKTIYSSVVKSPNYETGVFVPSILQFVEDGDVLIVNSEPRFYESRDIPSSLDPLVTQKIKVFSFSTADGVLPLSSTVSCSDMPASIIDLKPQDKRLLMTGRNIAKDNYEVYVRIAGKTEPVSLGFMQPLDGYFSIAHGDNDISMIEEVVLVTYTNVRLFHHP